MSIKEATRRALLDWSVSAMDLKNDPLFRFKPVRFKQMIKSSDIDRFLYYAKESKTLRKSERGSLPKLKPFVREKLDRFD